ncbi:MAG: hypothetical protein B7Z23_07510, partial [Pseudomonadales bacterium 32-61-5]
SEINAHPHKAGPVILVHNGIIENYLQLKEQLKQAGHSFKSETDTEVIAHLLEERLKSEPVFEKAVRQTLSELRGAYAVCILNEQEPGTLIAAKLGWDIGLTLAWAVPITGVAQLAFTWVAAAKLGLSFAPRWPKITPELKRLAIIAGPAILSGGFSYFARQLQVKLGIDYVYANELEIVDGKLTGVAIEPIVDAQRKADLLRELAQKEGLRLEQTIAVGDGANDLPMLGLAGLGVAFRAKPLVKQSAKQAISTLGLDGILYLLGFRDREGVE